MLIVSACFYQGALSRAYTDGIRDVEEDLTCLHAAKRPPLGHEYPNTSFLPVGADCRLDQYESAEAHFDDPAPNRFLCTARSEVPV
jgi:hypothetical protein